MDKPDRGSTSIAIAPDQRSSNGRPADTPNGELQILKQVSMLEHVARPGHFMFILDAIR
jgi:hypothetical protein